jgi:hypothetical protein
METLVLASSIFDVLLPPALFGRVLSRHLHLNSLDSNSNAAHPRSAAGPDGEQIELLQTDAL